MEEGPEPQEWVEKTVEHHNEEVEHGHSARLLPAFTAAVLAVLAALGSLLSGDAANRALVAQTKAADEWAFYQAKSTKQHVAETGRTVLETTAELLKAEPKQVKEQIDRLQKEVERDQKDKEEIRHRAEDLEAQSERMFHKHHRFATGVAALQVSIVLASITMLTRSRGLLWVSHAGGVVGLVFVFLGLIG